MKYQRPHRNKYAAQAGVSPRQKAEAAFEHFKQRSRNYYGTKRKGKK